MTSSKVLTRPFFRKNGWVIYGCESMCDYDLNPESESVLRLNLISAPRTNAHHVWSIWNQGGVSNTIGCVTAIADSALLDDLSQNLREIDWHTICNLIVF